MSVPNRPRSLFPKIFLFLILAAFALLVFYVYRVAHPGGPAKQQTQGQGSGEGGGAPGNGPEGPGGEKEKKADKDKKEGEAKDNKEKKPAQEQPEENAAAKSFWERLLDVLGFDQEAISNLKQSALGQFWSQAQNILAPIRNLFPSKPPVSPSKAVTKAAKENEDSLKQQQEMQDQINQSIQNNLALIKQTQDIVRTNQTLNQNIKNSLETQRNIQQTQQQNASQQK